MKSACALVWVCQVEANEERKKSSVIEIPCLRCSLTNSSLGSSFDFECSCCLFLFPCCLSLVVWVKYLVGLGNNQSYESGIKITPGRDGISGVDQYPHCSTAQL